VFNFHIKFSESRFSLSSLSAACLKLKIVLVQAFFGFYSAINFRKSIDFSMFSSPWPFVLILERHEVKKSIERVWNNTDSVELIYWDRNLLHCQILSTTNPSRNIYELKPGLRVQMSATKDLNHGPACLDVRSHWFGT